jgi:hypothetical protein
MMMVLGVTSLTASLLDIKPYFHLQIVPHMTQYHQVGQSSDARSIKGKATGGPALTHSSGGYWSIPSSLPILQSCCWGS